MDAKAKIINTEMKIAAVEAIRNLAMTDVPQEVLDAYDLKELSFGKDYIIPKPFDPRLIDVVPKAVFDAAVASGVAQV